MRNWLLNKGNEQNLLNPLMGIDSNLRSKWFSEHQDISSFASIWPEITKQNKFLTAKEH